MCTISKGYNPVTIIFHHRMDPLDIFDCGKNYHYIFLFVYTNAVTKISIVQDMSLTSHITVFQTD